MYVQIYIQKTLWSNTNSHIHAHMFVLCEDGTRDLLRNRRLFGPLRQISRLITPRIYLKDYHTIFNHQPGVWVWLFRSTLTTKAPCTPSNFSWSNYLLFERLLNKMLVTTTKSGVHLQQFMDICEQRSQLSSSINATISILTATFKTGT
jgi:hypothetical protein